MAHGLLQHKVQELKLDWEIDSAGTSGYHKGELPDRRAIACMKHHGIDITYQKSRPITHEDLRYYDQVFVMDESNLNDVMLITKTNTDIAKVSMIMSLIDGEYPRNVPDPYFGPGDKGFERVYLMLDKATDKLIEKYNGK